MSSSPIQPDEHLRYPVGRFQRPASQNDLDIPEAIHVIRTFPARLRELVEPLDAAQLALRYRPGGWTVAQVANHTADSHLNGYTRAKLGYTVPGTTIVPYDEKRWAELPDASTGLLRPSLLLLEGLHQRWTQFWEQLGSSDFERHYVHPESGPTPLYANLAQYSWHCRHHLGHILLALGR